MTVDFKDNSKAVLEAMQQAVERGLETCGLVAEGYAKKLAPVAQKNGGNLRNSITHKVVPEETACYIGSDVEYAVYQEMGTGKYYPGGRPTPWAYQDENGDWHWTHGNPAKPFLKPAVADHTQQYRQIMENELKNG